MSINNKEEPSTAPNPDQWYNLALGSSFKDHQPSYCTLRYEFKPASIDKSQPGALHKSKDNQISVEFHNNQPGKPKVTFEGSSEDYKENDAVLFFDGQTFRLERLHRAVKRLRHVRLPGESAASATAASVALAGSAASDASSPPVGRGVKGQPQNLNARPTFTPPPPPPVPVEVERIDIGEVEQIDIGDAAGSGGNPKNEKTINSPPAEPVAAASPDSNDFDLEAQLDIMNDDDDAFGPGKGNSEEQAFHTGIDINIPHQNDTDDEIADVDVNDDNGGMGRNAAEALRAQVNAVEREEQSSSSSASSGSESSSTSGSGSSSSDSESSEGDSVNSI